MEPPKTVLAGVHTIVVFYRREDGDSGLNLHYWLEEDQFTQVMVYSGNVKDYVLCLKYKDENPPSGDVLGVTADKALVGCQECLELIHA